MNKRLYLIILAVALLSVLPLFAGDDHEVVYAEGYPVKKDTSGFEEDIFIGDAVITGETVVTGDDETVELEAGGYKVTVGSNTVFRLAEVERGGETQTVLTKFGKMRFARDRATGRDPLLMSNSAVCGVRGTEFTLWAGDDGASLIVVESGAVEVSSSGESVELAKGEGVEVETGAAPGEKFQALAREIDHSEWNEDRLARMLDDPVAALEKVESRLDGYIEQIQIIKPLFDIRYAEMTAAKTERNRLRGAGDNEKADELHLDKVVPLQVEANNLFINFRFYALSALSLRRYVQGRMYMQMKSRNLTTPDAPEYVAFLEEHRRILEKYHRDVVFEPLLGPADI